LFSVPGESARWRGGEFYCSARGTRDSGNAERPISLALPTTLQQEAIQQGAASSQRHTRR